MPTYTSPIRVYTRTRTGGKVVEEWGGRRAGTRSRFQRCNQCNNGGSGSEDRGRHNVPLTCLYSCTERERLWEARRVHRRPCNLVIDQFVTIWHFVCTGPVNCVYPGHDDRRVNQVCLGTTLPLPSGCVPSTPKSVCPCPFSTRVLFFSIFPLFFTDVARITLFHYSGKDRFTLNYIRRWNCYRDENNFFRNNVSLGNELLTI